jgi:hypothetical protein
MTTQDVRSGPLLDDTLAAFDVVISESVVVDAPLDATYAAARELDFLRVRTPLAVAAMWVRGLPERFGRDGERAKPPPRLVLAEGDELPGWHVLAEAPGRELVFGAVGRFWKSRIEWHDVPVGEFPTFSEPGFGKIACSLRVGPCGDQTLLTYECRTTTTSADARAAVARYWWLVRPFVGHIMRATLATIRRDAEGDRRE